MTFLFRCDATADIGFGHLSRCIALAEALRLSGAQSTFAGMFDNLAAEQVTAAGFACANLPAPINTESAHKELEGILKASEPSAIILDSYRADEGYIAGLHACDPALVVIDDFRSLAEYDCDVVLNFTWEAPALKYPEGPQLLLGPNYMPTRRKLVELRSRSVERARPDTVRNLLIAVGGTDPKGIATRLLRNLRAHGSDICVHVIASSTADLAPLLSGFAPGSAVVPRQPDLSEQLLWADAAITGGGLIKYESAYMGVPAAAIAQNEGQDGETKVFARAGLVFDLGLADSVNDEELASALATFLSDEELRRDMATRMRDSFIPDPAANAANAILEAVRH